MDRRIGLAVALFFVLLMAWLYRGALSTPHPEPASTPVAAAAQVPVPTPPRARTPARTTPRFDPAPPPTVPVDDPVEETTDLPRTVVTGKVTDERGRKPSTGTKVLYKAGSRRRRANIDSAGTFRFEAQAESIDVWAERKDGALVGRSEKVTVDGTQGGEWEVDLVLASTERAGLGISIRRHEDGVFVQRVLDGSPAAGLGLMKGDLIIEVGGEEIAGQSVAEISGKLGGPVGTTQSFTIRRLDGSIAEMDFERLPIEKRSE